MIVWGTIEGMQGIFSISDLGVTRCGWSLLDFIRESVYPTPKCISGSGYVRTIRIFDTLGATKKHSLGLATVVRNGEYRAHSSLNKHVGFAILNLVTNKISKNAGRRISWLRKYFRFLLTQSELLCSEDIPDHFILFRVFAFGRSPRLYILHGSLSQLYPAL